MKATTSIASELRAANFGRHAPTSSLLGQLAAVASPRRIRKERRERKEVPIMGFRMREIADLLADGTRYSTAYIAQKLGTTTELAYKSLRCLSAQGHAQQCGSVKHGKTFVSVWRAAK